MTHEYLAKIISSDPGLPRENPTAPYWQKDPHPLASAQSPSFPATTDIAIIGSGITGASVTKILLEQHDSCNVTVLEARTLCSGATGRNGGQLAINAAQIYVKLKEAVGAEMAGKIVRFNIETLRRLREVAAEIDVVEYVELTDVVKLRCYQDRESFDHVKRGIAELEADHTDLKGIYDILDPQRCEKEHGVFGVVGGVLHPAGTIWPYKLVTKVFEVLANRFPTRLAIETGTPVSGVIFDPSTDKYPYRLSTPRGEVRAAQVAYCTNGYTGHLLPSLRGSIYPLKGTMTVQDMGASHENKGDSTSWAVHYDSWIDAKDETFADGLIYGMQNVKTGAMFFGGQKSSMADMLTADDTDVSSSSVSYLQESVSSLFGHESKPDRETPSIVSSWSGIMCFSCDRMPLVGRLPSSLTHGGGRGEWMCAGYCGYGMPSAWLAGESLGQMILGRSPQDVLPEAYLITQERLERMSPKKSVERLHD